MKKIDFFSLFFLKTKNKMYAYIFKGECPIVESGRWYYFSTPKTTRYLLSVCPQLIVINHILNKFLKRMFRTLRYKKKIMRPINIRRRECGLRLL